MIPTISRYRTLVGFGILLCFFSALISCSTISPFPKSSQEESGKSDSDAVQLDMETETESGDKQKTAKLVPPDTEGLSPGTEIDSAFGQALNLYNRGHYRAAAEILHVYLDQHPDDPQLPKSYYLLGNIQYRLKEFNQALSSYRQIIDRFPDSAVAHDSWIQLGACQFHLGELERARDLFHNLEKKTEKDDQLARIYFYLGEISQRQSNYLGAVENFLNFMDRSNEAMMADQAMRKINRLIRRVMTEDDLWNVVERFPKRYPADEALVRLSEGYSEAQDQDNLLKAVKILRNDFPDHPRLSKFLDQFQDPGAFVELGFPIKVGLVVPLTGPGSDTGQEILHGVQLAFSGNRELMEGKNIQWIIKDSQGDRDLAYEAVKELAEDNETIAILGPMFSQSVLVSIPLANQFQIPLMTPSAATDNLAGRSRFLFRNALTNRMQGKALARFAYEDLDLRRFSVLSPSNGYGNELMNSFSSYFRSLGGEVVDIQTYDPETQTDFGKQIRSLGGMRDDDVKKKILNAVGEYAPESPEAVNDYLLLRYQNSLSIPQIKKFRGLPLTLKNFSARLLINYEGLFIPGFFDKVGLILPELTFYNVTDVQILGGNGLNSEEFIRIGEQYSENAIFTDDFFIQSQDPKVQEFIQNYRIAFGEEPVAVSARAFDAANIVLSRIREGVVSRAEMRDALAVLQNYQGVTGETSMTEEGEAEKDLYFLTVKKGKIVELRPEDRDLFLPLEAEVQTDSDPMEKFEVKNPS